MKRNNKFSIPLISLLSLVFGLTACNNSSKTNEIRDTKPTSHIVAITAMKFVPDTVMARPGDTITFINKDLVTHNATQLPDSAWQSPDLTQGGTWSFVATKNDSFFCSIHVVMKGYIMMKD